MQIKREGSDPGDPTNRGHSWPVYTDLGEYGGNTLFTRLYGARRGPLEVPTIGSIITRGLRVPLTHAYPNRSNQDVYREGVFSVQVTGHKVNPKDGAVQEVLYKILREEPRPTSK